MRARARNGFTTRTTETTRSSAARGKARRLSVADRIDDAFRLAAGAAR